MKKKKEKRNKHMVFEYIIYVLFVCLYANLFLF